MTHAFPTLLSPLVVGSIEVRNRVVSTAHGAFLDFYRPGASGDRYIAYQERRARGGTGLIDPAAVDVHHTSQAIGHYTYDRDDLAPKLRRMADALHRRGARVLIQLLHFGGAFRSDANSDLEPLWGFGSFVSPTGSEAVHQMTPGEIEELVTAYVATATLAVECGLDGVELQASHGYLVQQSLSPWANGRSDEWGRPTAFASAILDGIRASVGCEPVVGLRVSVDDWVRPEHGGVGPARMRELTSELAGGGRLDLVNVSAGARAAHYSRSIGSYRHPAGPLLELTSELREALDAALPVIGVSRILTPELAEQALATRACDLVGMTRAQIADPDLVAKLEAGPQSGCGRAWAPTRAASTASRAACRSPAFTTPRSASSTGLPRSSAVPRRAECSSSAAGQLGSRPRRSRLAPVTPCGCSSAPTELGGALSWLRATRHRGNWCVRSTGSPASSSAWRLSSVSGPEATADELRNGGFDAIVLATGARPAPERLAIGDGSVPVLGLTEALADGGRDRDLLVVDNLGVDAVSITAEALAATARSVTVISPMQSVGAHIGFTMIKDQLQRLYAAGCRLEPSTALMRIDGGEVATRHVHSGQVIARRFDAIVAGVAGEPDLGVVRHRRSDRCPGAAGRRCRGASNGASRIPRRGRAGRAIGSPAMLTAF